MNAEGHGDPDAPPLQTPPQATSAPSAGVETTTATLDMENMVDWEGSGGKSKGVITVRMEDLDERTFKLSKLEKKALIVRALVTVGENGKVLHKTAGPAQRALMPGHVGALEGRFDEEGPKISKYPIFLYTELPNIVNHEAVLQRSRALAADGSELVHVSFVDNGAVYNFAGAHRAAAMTHWAHVKGRPAVWVANIMRADIATDPQYWALFHSLATNRRELGQEASALETWRMCVDIKNAAIQPEAKAPLLAEELGQEYPVRALLDEPMAQRVLSSLADIGSFRSGVKMPHIKELAMGHGCEALLLVLDLQTKFLLHPDTTADEEGNPHPELLNDAFWAACSIAYTRVKRDRGKYDKALEKAFNDLWSPADPESNQNEHGAAVGKRILEWVRARPWMWILDQKTLSSEIERWREPKIGSVFIELGRWVNIMYPVHGPATGTKFVDKTGYPNRIWGLFFQWAYLMNGRPAVGAVKKTKKPAAAAEDGPDKAENGTDKAENDEAVEKDEEEERDQEEASAQAEQDAKGPPILIRDSQEWWDAILELLRQINTANEGPKLESMRVSLSLARTKAAGRPRMANPARKASDTKTVWANAFRYLIVRDPQMHHVSPPTGWKGLKTQLGRCFRDLRYNKVSNHAEADRSNRVSEFLMPMLDSVCQAADYMPILMQQPIWFEAYDFFRRTLPPKSLQSDLYVVPRTLPEPDEEDSGSEEEDAVFYKSIPKAYRDELRERLEVTRESLFKDFKKSIREFLIEKDAEAMQDAILKAAKPYLRHSAMKQWKLPAKPKPDLKTKDIEPATRPRRTKAVPQRVPIIDITDDGSEDALGSREEQAGADDDEAEDEEEGEEEEEEEPTPRAKLPPKVTKAPPPVKPKPKPSPPVSRASTHTRRSAEGPEDSLPPTPTPGVRLRDDFSATEFAALNATEKRKVTQATNRASKQAALAIAKASPPPQPSTAVSGSRKRPAADVAEGSQKKSKKTKRS